MDDEAYTYNKKVNHAPPVAEYFMMLKALSHGVSEERLAKVLNVSISAIRQRRNMLDGVCKEAVEILRNSDISPLVFAALKKMKPIRQIEAAESTSCPNMLASPSSRSRQRPRQTARAL